MKIQIISVITLFLLTLNFNGCMMHTIDPAPVGPLYTNVTSPVPIKGNVKLDANKATKRGSATSYSALFLFAFGDSSIGTAMKNGGISKVHHVDKRIKNFFFFFYEYEIIVYGE